MKQVIINFIIVLIILPYSFSCSEEETTAPVINSEILNIEDLNITFIEITAENYQLDWYYLNIYEDTNRLDSSDYNRLKFFTFHEYYSPWKNLYYQFNNDSLVLVNRISPTYHTDTLVIVKEKKSNKFKSFYIKLSIDENGTSGDPDTTFIIKAKDEIYFENKSFTYTDSSITTYLDKNHLKNDYISSSYYYSQIIYTDSLNTKTTLVSDLNPNNPVYSDSSYFKLSIRYEKK